uniref:Uncharacterized protein n=1 Tax=Coccidioides posadasii RMSCC 3488 TaxID=454284 RepID=A0A0J6FUE1_COCPO|nr:hypothetical protein CPAG_09031 [Coccidioides posadasii RMSCC 3488]
MLATHKSAVDRHGRQEEFLIDGDLKKKQRHLTAFPEGQNLGESGLWMETRLEAFSSRACSLPAYQKTESATGTNTSPLSRHPGLAWATWPITGGEQKAESGGGWSNQTSEGWIRLGLDKLVGY